MVLQVTSPALAEIGYWAGLGVAVLPGTHRSKGSWPRGWPSIPAEETWAAARAAASKRPVNLAVRLGTTADGGRVLAHIDLDGKCPCGSDLADHEQSDESLGTCRSPKCRDKGCECPGYAGVRPDDALERLLSLLPERPLLVRTRRGYHAYLWSTREYPASVLPEFGADVAANAGALSVVPPSVHPSGTSYEYVYRPEQLPLVDLEVLGLHPVSKGRPRAAGVGSSAQASTSPLAAAPTEVQAEFIELLQRVGVLVSGRSGDEARICPWHPDTAASLNVNTEAAVFHCFGCGEGGGLRRLRTLAGDLPPTCNPFHPSHESLEEGLQLGGSEAIRERDRLAAALTELGETERSLLMRGCREFGWDTPEALEAMACPSGDSAPLRYQTNSCDDPQCPMCMPFRLAGDWRSRWEQRVDQPPEHLALVSLEAEDLSDGLDDTGYLKRVRGQFREWRRARGIDAGFYGLTLHRDGDGWRARLLLAVADSEAELVANGRAFRAHVTARDVGSRTPIRAWQHAYLNEATAWTSLDELRSFRLLTRGRRKFQGWGDHFGNREDQADQEADQEKEAEVAEQQPLHRMSGGSGGGARKPHACPRCGAELRRIGQFDPERMEIVQGEDGLREWRWKRQEE